MSVLRGFADLPLSQPRFVGKDLPRVEDPALLTGRAEFTDNVTLPGMLHAAILRSPHAHARIKHIDTSAAERLPGVSAVITGEHAARWSEPLGGMPPGWDNHCLATDKVRFAGERIAAVAAASRYIAEDALDLIQVEYEPLEPVVDPTAALDPSAPLVWEDKKTNVVYQRRFVFGEPGQAFDEAFLVVRDDFRWYRASGNPMETCGCIVQWDSALGTLVAYGGFQGTGHHVPAISRSLRVPAHRIRLVPLPHGGSFGTKVFPRQVVITALLSRAAGGRPVKWIEDRAEYLTTNHHGTDRRYSAEMALNAEGGVTAFRVRAVEDIGACVQSVAMGMSLKPLSHFCGPYGFRNVEYDLTVVATNKCPQGSYRGWGIPAHNLALEHCMDLGAKGLGLDPAEIRRRNLLRPGQFPYEGPTGTVHDSGDYERSLDLALDLADYPRLRAEQARARAEGRLVGIGVHTGVEVSALAMTIFTLLTPGRGSTSVPESVRLRLDGSCKLTAELTFPWEGQGQHTFLTYLLADYFGLQPEDVQVVTADSLSAGPGVGPIGSRAGVMVTGAALGAASRLTTKLATVAAAQLEAHPDDVELMDGAFRIRGAPGGTVSLQQVLTTMLTRSDLLPDGVDGGAEASYTYNAPHRTLPDANGKGDFDLTVANTAHVAMVEIDPDTGQVRILSYAIADDCGTRLHPGIVEGMSQGGLAQGVGHMFLEEHVYDDRGQYLTGTYMDHLLPTIAEVPMVRRTHTETPSPFSPLGAKGAGESAIMATPAVLMSAINDALAPLGVRCTTVPASPSRLWQVIQGASCA